MADLFSNGGASRMDAFAGKLIEMDGVFCWEPSLSYREPSTSPDKGRLSWIGEDLLEEGVHSAYRERWVRIAPASPNDFALALRHPEDSRQGWVLRVGSYLFFACQPAGSPQGSAAGDAEFSLFEMLPDAPRLVLSTVKTGEVTIPSVAFANPAQCTVRLSRSGQPDGAAAHGLWNIAAIEGAANVISRDFGFPTVMEPR
jgi:hypothetical protein